MIVSKYSVQESKKSKEHCLLVHGGGYSGFWNTLGKLNSYPLIKSQNIYCYSSGCLALLAKVNNININLVIDEAYSLMNATLKNYTNFYQIREKFITFLLDSYNPELVHFNISVISSNSLGKCFFHTINWDFNNHNYNKKLILDSTYIPAITGYYLESRHRYDGAFCHWNLPRCFHQIYPDLNYLNLRNIFNYHLTLEQISNLLNNNSLIE